MNDLSVIHVIAHDQMTPPSCNHSHLDDIPPDSLLLDNSQFRQFPHTASTLRQLPLKKLGIVMDGNCPGGGTVWSGIVSGTVQVVVVHELQLPASTNHLCSSHDYEGNLSKRPTKL